MAANAPFRCDKTVQLKVHFTAVNVLCCCMCELQSTAYSLNECGRMSAKPDT